MVLSILTSETRLPEKKYACHVLLNELLGIDYHIVVTEAEEHTLRLPNGADIVFRDQFQTFEKGGFTTDFMAESVQKAPNSRPTAHFDYFAATFFMLTRLEERSSDIARDKHGRFPADAAWASKMDVLHRPVVNEWADLLWTTLLEAGWQGTRKKRSFHLTLSCDVDHPLLWWSPTDRIKTLAGALLKRGNGAEARYWLQNHIFRHKDPYDVFDEWLNLFEQNNLSVQFNFMGERARSSDCWYPLKHPFVKNLMDKLARRGHQIGFHPSYEAFDSQEAFDRELASLQAVSPLEITAGRQHYLRFALPQTWDMWEAAGLKVDSTLGYPEAEGFRCGICHSFPVFDRSQRKMLQLREQPLHAMDVTLAQYRAYTPQQGAERLWSLRREVEKHGGEFSLLWHNSSWNTPFWEPWKGVFRDFITV